MQSSTLNLPFNLLCRKLHGIVYSNVLVIDCPLPITYTVSNSSNAFLKQIMTRMLTHKSYILISFLKWCPSQAHFCYLRKVLSIHQDLYVRVETRKPVNKPRSMNSVLIIPNELINSPKHIEALFLNRIKVYF